jgi:hypothetical protein
MSYCTLKENIIDGQVCPRCEKELRALLALAESARYAVQAARDRQRFIGSPAEVAHCYGYALDEVERALKVYDAAVDAS